MFKGNFSQNWFHSSMKNGVREQGIFNDHLVYRNENTQTRNINVPRLKNASDSQRAKKKFGTICTRLLGECIWLGLIGWKSNCSPTCAWKLSGKFVSQLSKRGAASQRFEAKLNGFWLLEIECKNYHSSGELLQLIRHIGMCRWWGKYFRETRQHTPARKITGYSNGFTYLRQPSATVF